MKKPIRLLSKIILGWPARIAIAAILLFIVVHDHPARLARLYFHELPNADVVAEANRLANEGEYAAAVHLLDSALESADPSESPRLKEAKRRIEEERSSLLARAERAFKGAVSGTGDSPEALAAVLVTDFFIIGDVRDILAESTRQVVDGESNKVVLALSGIGLATTFGGPAVDAMVSFMKGVAKRVKLAPALATWIADSIKFGKRGEVFTLMERGSKALRVSDPKALTRLIANTRDEKQLAHVFEQIIDLSRRERPSDVIAATRHLKSPDELDALTAFSLRRPGKTGAVALAGPDAIKALQRLGEPADEMILLLARKGDKGRAWLRTGGSRVWRPHPLIGLAKGTVKGGFGKLLKSVIDNILDPWGSWIIAGVFGWLLAEVIGLIFRSRRWLLLLLARRNQRPASKNNPVAA